MSGAKIKICGLRPGDNLSFTGFEQVSHAGFVFVPTSKRYVSPYDANELIHELHDSCEPVGVFMNQSLSAVVETCSMTAISTVQLHGDESPEYCRKLCTLGLKVWKTVPIPVATASMNKSNVVSTAQHYFRDVDAILLDSSVPGKSHPSPISGGSGIPFSWAILGGQDGLINLLNAKIWVAGGINPENVADLLTASTPFGIDVSSGVEIEGRKSISRIEELVKVVSKHGANGSVA